MRESKGKKQNKQRALQTSSVPTILSDKTRIVGDVTVAGDLKVAGYVEGDVAVSGKIVVAEGGRVFGNVEAAEAHISGKVNGDICVIGLLKIDATGQTVGDLKYELVEIESGGRVKGNLQPLRTEELQAFKEKHINTIGERMNGLSVVYGMDNKKTGSKSVDKDMGETAHW